MTRRGWGGRREGAGRKPLSLTKLRSRAVLIRLTPGEHGTIARAADGMPLATWLRELGLRAARSRKQR